MDPCSPWVSENPRVQEEDSILGMNVHFLWSLSVLELLFTSVTEVVRARVGLARTDVVMQLAAVCDLELGEERERRKLYPSNVACVHHLSDRVLLYSFPRCSATMCLFQLGDRQT